jgi:hypothetical protein
MQPSFLPSPHPGAARRIPGLGAIGLAILFCAFLTGQAHSGQPGQPGPAVQSGTTGQAGATGKAAPSGNAQSAKAPSKPTWRELNSRQQRALEPLAATWDELSEPHKQKWLAISRNYAKMSPQEQEVLHSRMTEWSRLSNQQREQARLNFAVVKQVPADERKAKWEAYQALSEDEKRKLANRASTTRAAGAAAAPRPASEHKFAPVPAVVQDAQHTPRIQLAPPPPRFEPPRSAAALPAAAAPVAVSAPIPAEAQTPAPAPAVAPTNLSAAPSAAAAEAPAAAAHPGEHVAP